MKETITAISIYFEDRNSNIDVDIDIIRNKEVYRRYFRKKYKCKEVYLIIKQQPTEGQ